LAQLFAVHPVNPQPRLIRQAAAIIRDGGVIAYPTDSGYALGCQLGDAEAARRIRHIRGVGDAHHLTLMLNNLS
jgi:tRNA A37 threonylcarbamoyladenosine synthetase subunit TsaC/SUA5/YrdC